MRSEGGRIATPPATPGCSSTSLRLREFDCTHFARSTQPPSTLLTPKTVARIPVPPPAPPSATMLPARKAKVDMSVSP